MAQVTAAEINKLRQMTGAGMMDCKKALEEANGDYEKAQEIIRKKGQLVAAKRADREATEGVVLAKTNADASFGALTVVCSETDFVAKNESFIKFASDINDVAVASKPADIDALKALKVGNLTVADAVMEKVGVIGEKIDLIIYSKVEAAQVVAYIHPGNKLATLVGFNKKLTDVQVGKDVAMQIAAMNPVAVDKASVPEAIVAKEREIAKEQTALDKKNEGKPANIIEKIAEGKLEKFFKENTLMSQEFVKDSKHTVGEYLMSVDKDLKVTTFVRYTLNA
ncbi:MAG TPA: translation elongation factor Ts [Bacteroidales bacterium]|nr:translation elongation factor Ts [Bacteroidales bacterium]